MTGTLVGLNKTGIRVKSDCHDAKKGVKVSDMYLCDALRNLVPFFQSKKLEKIHGGALLLVKLQAKSLQLY